MEYTPPARYGISAQTLHWLTAILVLVAFIYGPGGSEERIYAAARDFDRHLHETLGLSIFVLTFVRLLWRSVDSHPSSPQVAPWMDAAAKVVQVSLYVLLFTLPLTAIAGAWLEGHDTDLAWWDTLCALVCKVAWARRHDCRYSWLAGRYHYMACGRSRRRGPVSSLCTQGRGAAVNASTLVYEITK